MPNSARLKVLSGVGETIRSLRTTRGWTQEQLCKATRAGGDRGVSATAISRIERGDDLPNFSTVDRILEALDVSFATFLAMWCRARGEPVEVAPEEGRPAGGEDEVFLVWRLAGRPEREPKELHRQVKGLVQLAREVRESLQGQSESSREPHTKDRRRGR